jgi:hypothetical protein
MTKTSIVNYYNGLITFLTLFFILSFIGIHLQSPFHNVIYTICSFYGVIALIGGLFGIYVAHLWGGFKSQIGRSILFLSLGLLAQEFGQLSYNVYIDVFGVEVPYPSIGDLGYFGSVILYILGGLELARAAGTKYSLKKVRSKVAIVIFPLLSLVLSYLILLNHYTFKQSSPLAIFLDFGYPLGQAIYVSIAILAIFLTNKIMGGVMKNVILTILISFIIQYIADFTFLYQAKLGTWAPGGINDATYVLSYFVISLAFSQLYKIYHRFS